MNSDRELNLILVDDDPLFARLLAKVATGQRVRLTTMFSPKEAYQRLSTMNFDGALIDYDLGRVTGIQLSRFLEAMGWKVPVILLSQIQTLKREDWPETVLVSLNKSAGPYSILACARNALVNGTIKGGT
jgi:CheY-like chemotaxis protein